MNAQPQPNRLIGETSPYLLAHAHNPVDWYPWGEAAFAKARREDKPVFLSVGYSACHWCHVMARECFENRRVAERLNRDFISVKVDREERPDVDGVYQRACQALSGGGGWPLSVFMTADGEPFHAGTYYPPDAFLALLDAAADAWRHGRAELLRGGKLLAGALSDAARQHGPSDRAPIREATVQFRETFDKAYGGFGRAPKFPSPHSLMFLLHTAPELAEKTLEGMYRGGIFDHIGGGFSRYSTDRQWLVPHFEKMLGDNALLSITYLLAYEATGRPLYRAVAERTLSYMKRELRAPDGGFCSSQDADAQGAEGSYYLFTPEELKRLLGDEAGTRFCRRYDISAEGN
ncbi:MAG TPA: DUF255 domain-containing protein, partial [Oscillospiraceae bacterium]|nr:DUF255 domain-containing protein [Oscillospiraceae bacterium]